MTTYVDFRATRPGDMVVSDPRTVARLRRWEDLRQRHDLTYSKDVAEHPENRSREHYETSHQLQLESLDRQRVSSSRQDGLDCWYPVAKVCLESYGDLRFRIMMIFSMPSLAIEGTFDQARRAVVAKKGAMEQKRLVNFGSTDKGTRIERFSASGRKSRLNISHDVLGFEVVQSGYGLAEPLWCPDGLDQARTVLGEANGSPTLLGTGLPDGGIYLVNGAEHQILSGRDFDRGERL